MQLLEPEQLQGIRISDRLKVTDARVCRIPYSNDYVNVYKCTAIYYTGELRIYECGIFTMRSREYTCRLHHCMERLKLMFFSQM